MSGARVLRFVTRADCSLCDEGYELIIRYARRNMVRVETVDVDADPQLLEHFDERVPVVLGPGGAVLAEGRITKLTAKRVVARAKRPPS